MKKAISVLLLTVMCAMVFVGCGSGENSSSDLNSTESAVSKSSTTIETETTEYDIDGLKVEIPSSWRKKENTNDTTYFYSSINQDFVFVIVTDGVIYGLGDKEVQDAMVEGLKSSMENFSLLSISEQKNGDFDGIRLSGIAKYEEYDNKYYLDSFSFNYNDKFMQICYMSLSDNREECLKYFPKILASLKSDNFESDTSAINSGVSSKVESKAEIPTVTTSQKNALNRAKRYLKTMPFSYTGLIEQLEYEQYSHDDAVYAADNCGADWNEQAAKKAKSYLNTMAFSRKGLIEQLQYEGYTYEQSVYATDNCGADWNEQAAKKAQSYLDIMAFSRQGLIDQLQFEGYTYEQAVYGVNQVGL